VPPPTIQPPLQERSRRTLEKIGRAVESLLATRSFDDIGVADIVRKAGCSTGSFYARFASKDDVLPYLYARYDADLGPRVAARLASIDLERLTLRETVVLVVDHTVDMYAERRNLLRAVALYARSHPGAIGTDIRRDRERVTDMPATLLAQFPGEIRHADTTEAARIGFFMIAAICREKILFGEAPHASATPLSNERLKTELSRLLHAYLTCP
jgi:AcrR family transcriptional regulator